MINDQPIHSVIPSKKSNCSGHPICSSHLFLFLRKVKAQSLKLFWQDSQNNLTAVTVTHCWKGLIFGWRKTGKTCDSWQNFWRNLHFLTNKKWHFLVAKSFGA